MADFTLTSGSDTVAGTANSDTVNGTEATLNSGDSLTGGAGTDTLALSGAGEFRVDQLATFTGFENITLLNTSRGYPAALYLGSQSIAVTGYGWGDYRVFLGSGAVTFQGDGFVFSNSAADWNTGNSINGGSASAGYINLNWNSSDNAVYDLTTNTLSHIRDLSGYGANLTVQINSAVAGGVASFHAYGPNAKLVTSDAALDLSYSTVRDFTVASSNASGTNFTVHDIGTAFQVAGGSGTDTLTAQGFVFSADERNAIFTTASVERIVDASGTYTAPPQNPDVFTLTTGSDTIAGTAADNTVLATAATLNSGDSLTGGAGTDTLALSGYGEFRVDQLATFTGFENITLLNTSTQYSAAALYLGSQSIAVTGYGAGYYKVFLGSGAVTFQGGRGNGYNFVFSNSAADWNTGNSIDGGSSGYITLNWDGSDNAVYDLTTNTLSHITDLSGYGANLTVQINSAVAGGVASFSGSGPTAKLVTSDAALDLSHSMVTNFTVMSSNASGTNFTVHDIATAFQVAGGSGTDTITAQGFAFSTDQRNAIFAASSIEKIVDQTGTYTVDNDQPTLPTVRFAGPNGGNDVSESAGTLTHTLTLSAPSSQTVSVTVRGGNGGTAGSADLGLADQVITFAPGQTTATFTTAIHEDALYEGDEMYFFEIVSATGAQIDLAGGDRQLWGDILDNDQPTLPTVRFAGPNGGNDVSESAGTLTHTLTLSAPSSQTVSVTVRGGNGGTAGSADLGLADQVITFAPGQTTATFTTAIHEDALYEGDEMYFFEIVSATGAQIDLAGGDRQLWGDILDNDQPTLPTVRFAGPNGGNDVSESAGTLTHTLTLSAPSSQTVSVTVRGGNGGTAGSADLGLADQVITFAPGQTTATFTTAIHEDALYEGDEMYFFEIVSATGAQIDLAGGDRQLWGDILDNDPGANNSPMVTSNSGGAVAAVSIAENTTAITTVTATDPDVGQTLSYSISGGADESKFTIDATTGELSFFTAPNFEAPTDTGGNNVYDVTVQVSDGQGGVDTQAVAVSVENVGSTVNGTSQAQTLTGTGQEDFLYGMGGNDNLQGLAGNDYLDGGLGKDTMTGGAGNDTYVVDNSGDVVIENPSNGTDTVLSYISFTLGANFEWLTLSGSGKIDGTGNALDNNVTGNSGNNKLSGLAGNDLLYGGAGNDTLVGGLGADLLTGGAGADRFVYSAVADSTLAQLDVIQDFVHGADMIDIAAIDANAAKKSSQAFAFAGENTGVVANSVTWYENKNLGKTFVQADVNGDTNADLLIELAGTSLHLSVSDFLL